MQHDNTSALTIVKPSVYSLAKNRRYTCVMTDENFVDQQIKRIDAYLAKSGMAESRLGLLACANARAVERVRDGTARVETLRAILEYIASNPIQAR